MPFDPTTAYAADYQWLDFIEDITWEVPTEAGPEQTTGLRGRWGDFDTPDFASVAAGLGLSSNAAAVVVWQPKPADVSTWEPTFVPKPGDILRREAQEDQGWVILSSTRSRFGHWLCACEKEVVNA